MQGSLEVEARHCHDDHSMPLHGPKLEALDSCTEMVVMRTKLRGVISRVVARDNDDQLVGAAAIRRETGHRVLGALELVAVADEDQATRGQVWLRSARKGRSKGNQGSEHEDAHRYPMLQCHVPVISGKVMVY